MKSKNTSARGIGNARGGSSSSPSSGTSGRVRGPGGLQPGGDGGGNIGGARPIPGGGIQGAPPPMNPVATPQPVTNAPISGVNPLMVSSLPPMASGADIYARQFYRGSQVPYRRYLPVSLK